MTHQALRKQLWVRGAVLAALAGTVLVWPDRAPEALIGMLALFVLADGIVTAVYGMRSLSLVRWIAIAQGTVSGVVGVAALIVSDDPTVALTQIFAVWAIVVGVLDMGAAIRMDNSEVGGLLGVSGVLSVAVGIILAVASSDIGLLIGLFGAYQLGRAAVLLTAAARVPFAQPPSE